MVIINKLHYINVYNVKKKFKQFLGKHNDTTGFIYRVKIVKNLLKVQSHCRKKLINQCFLNKYIPKIKLNMN